MILGAKYGVNWIFRVGNDAGMEEEMKKKDERQKGVGHRGI